MIVFTTEPRAGTRVVRVDGGFEPIDDPAALVDHLTREAGSDPLIIDLTGLEPVCGPGVVALLSALAHSPSRTSTVLVHPDLATRRALRSVAEGIPVVPDPAAALSGRFSAALANRPEAGGR